MRMLLLFLPVFSVVACCEAAFRDARAQQPAESYAPQTYAPQTWTPQTFAPQTHSPPAWTPQTGDSQVRTRPRRWVVKCMVSEAQNDYCEFYSDRDFRRGSPCSCDGSRGTTW